MRRPLFLIVAAALAAAPASAQIERQRGGGHGGGGSYGGGGSHGRGSSGISRGGGSWRGGGRGGEGGEQRASSPPVIIKQRRVEVPAQQPRAFDHADRVVRDQRRASPPARDDHGRAITQTRASQPPAEHTTVVRNQAVVHDIVRQQRVEVVPNRYYWHTDHGIRYAHYYDGVHWYGFYHGPHFYWTRYWYDRWWWYDPTFSRWVFFYDGYWWWPGPHGRFYVYVDNSYYPYESGAVYVKEPQVDAPPAAAPAPNQGSNFDSPDGTRQVQIYGDRSEAFLYDKTPSSPVFLTYLGGNVQNVRFSGGTAGKPLRILLDFKDGSFALFDKAGKPLDEKGPEAPTRAALPATPPPSIPTPPGGETAPSGAGQAPSGGGEAPSSGPPAAPPAQ